MRSGGNLPHVDEGELVCLLGGNASGKSTTLKTILGIVRPRSGHVLLGGEDVTNWPVAAYRLRDRDRGRRNRLHCLGS